MKHLTRVVLILLTAGWLITSVVYLIALYGVATKGVYDERRDFLSFYVAGSLIRQGRGDALYSLPVIEAEQRRIFPQGKLYPFLYFPYQALPFVPFSLFPYATAFALWALLNLTLLGLVVWLLHTRLLPLLCVGPRFPAMTLAAAVLAYFPTLVNLVIGQISIGLFLIFTLSLLALRRGRARAAGMLLALGLFKFHLLLPLLLCFAVARHWRLLGGFAIGALALGMVSLGVAGRHAPAQYIDLVLNLSGALPGDERMVKVNLMPNLRSFLMASGHDSLDLLSLRALILGLSAAGLAPLLWLWRKPVGVEGPAFNLNLALALSVTLLIAYHSYLYDYMLFLIPLFLTIDYALADSSRRGLRVGLLCLGLFFLTPIPYYLFLVGTWRGLMLIGPLGLIVLLGIERYHIKRTRSAGSKGP